MLKKILLPFATVLTKSRLANASIGHWVLLRMALLLTSIALVFIFAAIQLVSKRFDVFDENQYKSEATHITSYLHQDRATLEALTADYASWDETVDFINSKKPNFLVDNFTHVTFKSLQFSSVVITQLDRTVFSSLTLTNDDTLDKMPPALLAAFAPHLKKITSKPIKTTISDIVWLNHKPYLVTASAITDSLSKNPPSGYMFLIHNLDAAYIAHVEKTTGIKFSLQELATETKQALGITQNNEDSLKSWTVSKRVDDLSLVVLVGGPTRLHQERLAAYWSIAGISTALIIISLAGIYAILNLRILHRLRVFATLANRYQTERDYHIRWPMQGNDELDKLGESLNELITEVNAKHQKLSFLAEHDPLTGIGNRRRLHNRLDAAQNRIDRRSSLGACLLLLDLDSFKLINDGLGHTAGDKVLQVVASRLMTLSRNYDTVTRVIGKKHSDEYSENHIVTRMGGDEFAVLLEDSSTESAHIYAERLLRELEQPIEIDSQSLVIHCSIGIAKIDPTLTKEEIVRNADLAMYEAKRRGKNQVATFNIDLLDQAARRLQLEQALKQAIDMQSLEVWFQPIVGSHVNKTLGMEALCRWKLNGSYIPANEFIYVAESTGMIVPLGELVLQQTCLALQKLRATNPNLQCSINLSVRQFRETDLAATIPACLQRYELPIDAINFELTESMIAENEQEVLPKMLKLVEMGCKFYLDDFGTGYSSLDRLRRLPFSTLKIDRSFVSPLSHGDDIMARNIINIGQELNMELIAEGVETAEELRQLTALGCTQFQGYYFAKPMPFNELRDWLSAQTPGQAQA